MKIYPGRAPNYIIKKEYAGLPEGSFVRPVRLYFLPPETIKNLNIYDETKEVACYTSKGFIAIPIEIIEQC